MGCYNSNVPTGLCQPASDKEVIRSLADRPPGTLHLALTPTGDGYSAAVTQVARDFKRPIDAVLDGDRLSGLEFDPGGALWELTFGAS